MSRKKKFYGVAVGRVPGVYTTWFGPDGAEVQVKGFQGAKFKSFATRAEAEAFIKNGINQNRSSSKNASRKKAATFFLPEDEAKALALKRTLVFTDGGAINNPGPGGYGVVIQRPDGKTQELSGGYRLTTNNRMELTACIVGLEALPKTVQMVTLVSDSRYVVDGITKGWAKRWQKNNWMRTKTEKAINSDLWQRLLKLCQRHQVDFKWIKGHAGHAQNERCDKLAVAAARSKDLHIDTAYEAEKKDQVVQTCHDSIK